MKKTNIVFAGEGGQGIQTIAKILTGAISDSGFEVSYMPSFGVEQRGTPSVGFLTLSSDKLRYPKFTVANIAIILQKRAIKAVAPYINPNTEVIFDSSAIAASDLPKSAVLLRGIPAMKYASENLSPRVFNIIVAGIVANFIGLKKDIVWKEIELILAKKLKNKDIAELNKAAFDYGFTAVFEKDDYTSAIYKTKHKEILLKGYGKNGQIIPSRCKGCGICIFKCPVAALSPSDVLGVFATPVPQCDLEKCIGCGNCRAFCPDSAISINKDL